MYTPKYSYSFYLYAGRSYIVKGGGGTTMLMSSAQTYASKEEARKAVENYCESKGINCELSGCEQF